MMLYGEHRPNPECVSRSRRGSEMAASNQAPLVRTEARQSNEALRVLVVSSIRLLQDAFTTLLAERHGITVVGTAKPAQASGIAEELRPDIVLFDATRPGNLDYVKALADQQPAPKVVAFGVAESDAEIVTLAAAGVSGYVSNDAAADEVAAVLASAMRGE